MLFDLGCELVYLEVVREIVPPIEPWAFLGLQVSLRGGSGS